MCDTGYFVIDLIINKYRANIEDIDINTDALNI